MGKTLRIGLCMGLLLAAPVSASAEYPKDAGVGTMAVMFNVVYIPAKLTYATLGGLTGALAYVLTGTNREVAERVWKPSLGGDYVVKPSHIKRQETLYFSAPIPAPDDLALSDQPLP